MSYYSELQNETLQHYTSAKSNRNELFKMYIPHGKYNNYYYYLMRHNIIAYRLCKI